MIFPPFFETIGHNFPSMENSRFDPCSFLEFVLMMFGRPLQKMDDKSRFVFDSLYIVPESQAQKALYVSLKLLPSLIRCLLIHCQ